MNGMPLFAMRLSPSAFCATKVHTMTRDRKSRAFSSENKLGHLALVYLSCAYQNSCNRLFVAVAHSCRWLRAWPWHVKRSSFLFFSFHRGTRNMCKGMSRRRQPNETEASARNEANETQWNKSKDSLYTIHAFDWVFLPFIDINYEECCKRSQRERERGGRRNS